jgi:hypothetical protein
VDRPIVDFDHLDDRRGGRLETPPGDAFRLVRGGGDEGDRTLYPLLAKQVLCQLSYVPENGK